jgi:hypothetical protein
MSDTVVLVLTALGAGAAASVVTTFGSQVGARREARREVLARLAEADGVAGRGTRDRGPWRDAGRSVVSAALMAGVPLYVADTWTLGYDALWEERLRWAPERLSLEDPASVGLHVYREALGLLMLALWHPVAGRLVRRQRSRRIRRFLVGVLPPGSVPLERSPREVRRWERRVVAEAQARNGAPGPVSPAAVPPAAGRRS